MQEGYNIEQIIWSKGTVINLEYIYGHALVALVDWQIISYRNAGIY
jgi:hypothetical protein